ncbi:TIGR04063 family PEP-CTERM/XrtA system glycosyltransferase [Pseudomonadota bacterium]
MKILHIFDHSIPLHSGYTFRSRAILEQQRALGWQTEHVTSAKHGQASETDELEQDVEGFHFYRTSQPTGIMTRIPGLNQMSIISSLTKRLAEIIPLVKPDILHAHSPALNGMAAVNAGRQFGLPVVYEIRAFWEDAAVDHGTCKEGGLRYRLTRDMETKVIRQADAVTTICDGLRKDIVARGINEAKVSVIPNAVDPEKFSLGREAKQELQEKLGLAGCRVLGFIGSFYAYEGLSLLLQTLPQICARHNDIKVLLVGGGPQEQALRQQANELGIESAVIFTGRVPHTEVNDYYDLVDILVYPRLSMRLTELVTPLKPLEAMAQGRLFIASDVGGHHELVEDGVTGRLFKAGDVAALAGLIDSVLAEPGQWPLLKANGRKYVEEVRNWKNSVSRYQVIYERLLDK